MSGAIIVAIIGAIGSLVLAIFAKHKERIAVIEQDIRQRKIPIYNEILHATGPLIDAVNNKQELPTTRELTQKVATWASTPVLVYYLLFRAHCEEADPSPDALIEAFTNLVFE